MIRYTLILVLLVCSCKRAAKNELHSLLKEADKQYWADNFQEAIKRYDSIIKIDTTIGIAYFRRAYCKALTFDLNGSSLDYRKSIELNFNVAESYYGLGANYASELKDSIAAIYFEKAYQLDTTNTKYKEFSKVFKPE